MNKFWLGIGALAILLIVVLMTGSDSSQDQEDPNSWANTSDWDTYQSETLSGNYQFTIKHPRSIDPEVNGDFVRFMYAGPENADPALTDGFNLSVTVDDYQSIEELTNDAASTVKSTSFNGLDAYRFGTKNELYTNLTNNIVVILDEQYAATITYSVVGPEDMRDQYSSVIDDMLDTLRFNQIPDNNEPDKGDGSNGDPSVPTVDQVSLALLSDPSGEADRGCDDIKMITRQIEPTTAPLTRSIELLFETSETNINGARHFIPNTADTLQFDRATVVNGTANIYLTGELSGINGVCDNPRTAIQIEETAKQFSTVNQVQLYLNGSKTDLIPSER